MKVKSFYSGVEIECIPWDEVCSMTDRICHACPVCGQGTVCSPIGGLTMAHKECLQEQENELWTTKKEKEDAVNRMMKIQKLLVHFGLGACAFDPGVRCFVLKDGLKMVEFDCNTWEWLEPLLKELLKHRRKHEVASKRSS